jgi:murein DD-endopeptidase MepM/ murein hydrolase activator NlpD
MLSMWFSALLLVSAPPLVDVRARGDTQKNGRLAVYDVVVHDVVGDASVQLGKAKGALVPWRSAPGSSTFLALVPVDPDASPGESTLELTFPSAAGGELVVESQVQIGDAHYERKDIRVGKQFTSPSKAQKQRAKKEAKEMEEALSTSSPQRLWRGTFLPPTAGGETSPFGTLRTYNKKKKSRHLGLDLDGDIGAPVFASNRGRVVLSSDRFYSGGTIVIDHGNGLFSMYFHLSKRMPKVGQLIERGEGIGAVGKSGQVTGPHLHFSIKMNGIYVDGAALLATSFDDDPLAVRQSTDQSTLRTTGSAL